MNNYDMPAEMSTQPATYTPGYGSGYGATAQDVPSVVPSVVYDIQAEVERLSCAIDNAQGRLQRVLAPEYDGPEKAGSVPHQVSSEIRQTHLTLSQQVNRLNELIGRVEA